MLKSHIPEKLEFTFYKDEEIVKMSVMEVTKPLSLDAFNNPYPDGLCDPRMGSHNNDNICKSCNLSFLNCPGHFGYIKLAKPVFNPLIFTTTYSLLKATCFKCGLLKLSKYERIIIYLKLNLLKRGCSIDNLDYLYGINSESKLCKKVADILLENSKVEMISSNFNHQEFVDLILKSAAARNKCLVCRNKGCKLICNKNLKISIVEDNNAKVTYTTFYPEKILEIFKNLFSNERDLMEGMFSTNNFKMFFIFNIAVPPVKFRPMNYLNGRSYENPQNIHYIRILNCNAELNNGKDFWAELQAAILAYYDSSKSSYNKNEHVAGHKQILEKKEGLFRRNIMGKRVNFAARSVISPDPNLKTREMGIPKIFAEKLTFPEKVNLNNYNQLRKAVINGKNYPGANTIQNGKILQSLEFLSHEKRVALANQLLSGNKIVWRHLKDGDNVLVNRQPTLHIPSIMGHKVRVLQGEKTLRMHYVNCKPYNADFDGDEMNVHFPQSDVAQAEIEYLSLNDNMYLVPTNGEPIRGLTQDHIVAASILTLKNSFYTKEHYIDLLVAGLPNRRLKLEAPCISYPIELFSGKQIVTSLLKNLNLNINLSINGKVDALTWLDHIEEKTVEFKNGEMLTGILDKNVLGPTKFSLIHACGELFGYALTNDLLSYFSNIINRYLFIFGFTMRVDDLLLNKSADILRKKIIEKGELEALKIQKQYIEENPDYYLNLDKTAQLDALVREKMNFVTTEIVKASVPEGQLKRFPENNMGLIIITGAKGSMVNLSQISGSLGQQELEGKRVMHMISGKTLPCFDYFECSPSAGGYVFQRFLTGVEPHEYFFHCMAGREGLIDTAVKTSRSGYLQRCLIKHLEGLKVEYDLSVRMGKKIIQYIYGEDGLDFTKSSFIHKIQFFKDNMSNIKCNENLKNYFDQFQQTSSVNSIYNSKLINEDEKIKNLCHNKYIKSLVDPGEAVGVIAGQSLGEPSTQMTLNTFHLAGVGAKNVTLGIPRLREIVMVASKNIKTPMIVVPLKKEVPKNVIENYQKLTLDECIENIEVKEKLVFKQGVYMKEITITVVILKNEKLAVPYLDNKFLFLLGRQIKKLNKKNGTINILEISIKEETEKENEEDSDNDESSTKEDNEDLLVKTKDDSELENEQKKDDEDEKIEKTSQKEEISDESDENNNEIEEEVFIKTNNFKKISNKKYTFSAFYPTDFNIMLIPVIESILPKIVIRETRNISKATISENNMIFEGSDFLSLIDLLKIEDGKYIDPLEFFDIYKSTSNDIYSISNFLGIEAARESIINEIISVFDAYGIEIDIRHLMLIADYMTRNGEYVPFNRTGLNYCNSPLQKMSFESCFTNLKKASEFHVSDDLSNPSASLTVGTPVKVGTNTFEILYNMDSQTV